MDRSLSAFRSSTARWFEESIGDPTAVQREGWPVISSGRHALICAPTGTGKTLTAFLWFVDRLTEELENGELRDAVQVVYISPLKSLANDINENLKRPLEGINSKLRCAVRNGDTTAQERRNMIRRPPHILLTTPESLYLLLTSQSGRNMLRDTRAVIIDELHAVINDKRGAHLMLSIERLDALCGREVQRIGLSATIRPLHRAAGYLAGVERAVAVVAPEVDKAIDVTVNVAVEDMRILPQNSIWPEICREVYEASRFVKTVLVFCQGRATAEKVAHGINAIAGEGYARTHHGSMSKDQRQEAEQMLRAGELHILCATSSMELGIDVGDIDLVAQVGVPQTVASALQRLGRAGHRPGEVSVMRFYPRTYQDLLLAIMTVSSVRARAIEEVRPPRNCLDILAQHLVSMAAAGDYTVSEAHRIISRCQIYETLKISSVEAVLRMLAGDYEHAQDRPVSPRLHYDRIGGNVIGNNLSRMLALSSGGTIPDRGMYAVVLQDGTTRLGELDEEYVFEARQGDRFMLGTFAWEIVSIDRDKVIVRPTGAAGAQTPFWKGDGMNREYETGLRFGKMLAEFGDLHSAGRLTDRLKRLSGDTYSALNAARYIGEQISAIGALATDRLMVEERFKNETGENLLMLHSIFGGMVNRGLAMLIQDSVEQATNGNVRVWYDDDGVLVHLLGGLDIPPDIMGMLDGRQVEPRLRALMPGSTLFSMVYRYNAARALMMGVKPGGRVPLWVQRIRAAESYARALEYPDHPLLIETLRECMEQQLDIPAIGEVVTGVQSGRIKVYKKRMNSPSPMTITLRRMLEAEMMYEYSPMPSAAKGAAIGEISEDKSTIEPERRFVEDITAARKAPADREQLHSRLMIEGDARFDELDAPGEWLEYLAASGRAEYIEPGLWIAAEHADEYRAAFEGASAPDMRRIVRRCLRYRGAMTAGDVSARYALPLIESLEMLGALVSGGEAVERDGEYFHAEVYERAQRMTISARRRDITTAPPDRYAELLSTWQIFAGSGPERLIQAVAQLSGMSAPAELWEGVIFPARVPGYRPKMLDDLLARGEAVWRLIEGDRPSVCFDLPDEVDWEAEPDSINMSANARTAYDYLSRRGASFAHMISAHMGGAPVSDALRELTEIGAIRCDSFVPLRSGPPSREENVKRRVQSRTSAQDAGRWEIARPPLAADMAARIDKAFGRWAILCRETASLEGIDWKGALTVLRVMEFTGKVRRGYFVEGLSGAQFVRSEDFLRVTSMLGTPGDDYSCLCAIDPMQAWGRILPLPDDIFFMCVPGTAIVARAGRISLIVERRGAVLRTVEDDPGAYSALASAFTQGRIFSGQRSLTVKQYPTSSREHLERAGFVREMMDYVIWRG